MHPRRQSARMAQFVRSPYLAACHGDSEDGVGPKLALVVSAVQVKHLLVNLLLVPGVHSLRETARCQRLCWCLRESMMEEPELDVNAVNCFVSVGCHCSELYLMTLRTLIAGAMTLLMLSTALLTPFPMYLMQGQSHWLLSA